MDSILVFDDFKHCFRELDTSNYNDDLVVGSVFFTRDAINVIEKYYRIIGYIICDDKGVYYPIDVRKNDIAILEGTYNCIEDELKKELVPYNIKIAPAEVWILLFENIVTRFAESDYGTIASLWGDFTIFSIHYLSRRDKDKIKALFDCLCKTHESLSSANGRVKIKEEKLILDENITSLSDMVNFQLNI